MQTGTGVNNVFVTLNVVDEQTRQKVNHKMKETTETGNGIIPTIVICEMTRLICKREGKQKADMIYL